MSLAVVGTGKRLTLCNRVINPSGQFYLAGLVSTADAAYCGFDQWYGLTQSNPITPSQLTNVEDGLPTMMRFSQANASAQRFGVAQPFETIGVKDLRGQRVAMTARVRMSAATTLRYALIEWTGTADSITKDVVNSWTNTTFTTGNFFISTSTTIVATGSIALASNTLTDIVLTGTVSSSMNNLILFLWTDSTQAQNTTLDVGKVGLYLDLEGLGNVPTFEQPDPATELARLQRFYEKSYALTTAPGTATQTGAAGLFAINGSSAAYLAGVTIPWVTRKRVAPTVTMYSFVTGTSGKIRDILNNADVDGTAASYENQALMYATNSASAAGYNLQWQWTADARL